MILDFFGIYKYLLIHNFLLEQKLSSVNFVGFHVSTEASLGIVALSLSTGVLLSLTNKSSDS